MLNQVTIEGYIVSQWCYKGDTFLRIAHHRPRRKNEIIHSDYITVKAGKKAQTGANLQQGDLVRVKGEIWGRDILEPLGRVLQKARLNIELSPELENLVIPRPTSYVVARQVSLIDLKREAHAAARVAGRPVKIRPQREEPAADLETLKQEST